MKLRIKLAILATCLVYLIHISTSALVTGVKPVPGLENLPKLYWHELSSPFTEINQDENLATENGAHQVTETTPEPKPYFLDPTESNVTVQLGAQVHLHCKVENLQKRMVSWVRRRGDELHLLTFGIQTYSSDSRFSLDYQMLDDWRLLLRSATERDAGIYECQVSAHPRPLVRTVYLTVSVPRVVIVDEYGVSNSNRIYQIGSTIELKCQISGFATSFTHGYVTWRHGDRTLNYDTTRGGISVKTDMGAEGAVSRLYIANANKGDSGNYSCALAEVAATTVSVHVLNGENPAAMQHGGSANIKGAVFLVISLIMSTLLR